MHLHRFAVGLAIPLLTLLLALGACTGAEGDPCQESGDCSSGLMCCKTGGSPTERGTCEDTCTGVRPRDAGTDTGASDAGDTDAEAGDAGDAADAGGAEDAGDTDSGILDGGSDASVDGGEPTDAGADTGVDGEAGIGLPDTGV